VIAAAVSLALNETRADWQVFKPIVGVGKIARIDPDAGQPGGMNRHYGGGLTPAETATFEIDVKKAVDMDCNNEGDRKDAGLEEKDTVWEVTLGSGTMEPGVFASGFCPNKTIHKGIEITCRVYEGHKFSWTDANHDAPVTRKWDGMLNTFKVGVKIDPTNVKVYEDEDVSKAVVFPSLAQMDFKIPSTGDGSRPGKIELSSDNVTYEIKWTALADTSDGSLNKSGIRKSIVFAPQIHVAGEYYGWTIRTGLASPDFDLVGKLSSTLSGSASPYAEAGMDIVFALIGKPDIDLEAGFCFGGVTVIENVGKRQGEVKHYGKAPSDIYKEWEMDFNGLTIVSKPQKHDVQDQVRGSFEANSLVAVVDKWWMGGYTAAVSFKKNNWLRAKFSIGNTVRYE
jgi:hypothetical protein